MYVFGSLFDEFCITAIHRSLTKKNFSGYNENFFVDYRRFLLHQIRYLTIKYLKDNF
ncbi:predicted protein [Enterococcus faecium 1,231,408]|nr:predicted protein [Enterococcus faecium 1,230,933]EEV52733.1 predicted protein [Enterococcus faecium 1,231,410]EEV55300.1 predicted protein [Enterococcus faecium 1,231,408]